MIIPFTLIKIQNHISMQQLTCDDKFIYGYNLVLDDTYHLVLHNENIIFDECVNWTRMHEIGHIKHEHTSDDHTEEIEANFFAACSLIPDAVIRKFLQYRVKINNTFITENFNVSQTAASKKIMTLNKYFPKHKYDDDVIKLFLPEIEMIVDSYFSICV